MGSSISALVKEQNDSLKAQAQDQLTALLTMAELKYENFMGHVKSTADKTLIPVNKILLSNHVVHAKVTSTGEGVQNAVKDTVTAFAKGDILTGVTSIVDFGVKAVLADVAANQSQHRTYAITCGELGGIMRIDIDIFCYTFTSAALTAVTNNVVSTAYVVSSVDASKLDTTTLRDIVQVCYGGVVDKDQLMKIYELILSAYEADTTRARGILPAVPDPNPTVPDPKPKVPDPKLPDPKPKDPVA